MLKGRLFEERGIRIGSIVMTDEHYKAAMDFFSRKERCIVKALTYSYWQLHAIRLLFEEMNMTEYLVFDFDGKEPGEVFGPDESRKKPSSPVIVDLSNLFWFVDLGKQADKMIEKNTRGPVPFIATMKIDKYGLPAIVSYAERRCNS